MELHLAEAGDTDALGAALAQTRPPSAVVHLRGDLGAGKSTLARALLRALGVTGSIRSPTYTLVERYPLPGADGVAGGAGEAWHLDLYRIGNAGELDFLGLDEGAATLWLVEWPERGGDHLPAPDLGIELAIHGHGRRAVLRAGSPVGDAWVDRLHALGQLAPVAAAPH